MVTHIAFIWDSPVLFTRLFEDCGHSCELITPDLLAAPFFRRNLHGAVIPAGFASPDHIRILIALRAIHSRIERFVKDGGTLLVFGAGSDQVSPYDWLPVPVTYRFGFVQTILQRDNSHPCVSIIEEGTDVVSIDGTLDEFPEGFEGQVVLRAPEGPVLVTIPYGKGRILVTSLHEYPSHHFVRELCAGEGEGLL